MNPETLLRDLGRVGPAARVVLSSLRHRGELAVLEAGEAGDHLAGSLALGLGAVVLAVLGGFAVNLALAAAVWHRDDRGLVLAFIAAVELLLALGIGLLVARRLRHWRPLAETRRQLDEDCECIQELLPSDSDSDSRTLAPTP